MSFNIELGGTALCLLLSCSTWASGPGLANDCINQTKSIPAEWKTVIEINGYNCEIDFQRLFNLIYVSHESESLIFAGGCVWWLIEERLLLSLSVYKSYTSKPWLMRVWWAARSRSPRCFHAARGRNCWSTRGNQVDLFHRLPNRPELFSSDSVCMSPHDISALCALRFHSGLKAAVTNPFMTLENKFYTYLFNHLCWIIILTFE